MQISETYNRIRDLAPSFYQRMVESARRAHNEAEFEREMNNEIDKVARQLEVQLSFRQEYTVASGRADAVYNRFVIEYEPPQSLRQCRLAASADAHQDDAHAFPL